MDALHDFLLLGGDSDDVLLLGGNDFALLLEPEIFSSTERNYDLTLYILRERGYTMKILQDYDKVLVRDSDV